MSEGMENCETKKNLHRLVCGSPGLKKFLKPRFSTFGVFTKYRCCNPSKWPQMPQKWVNTIPFGPGHTLGTLNHGLESLFYCFITLFGLKSSLVPPGAPWRLPGPPGAPLTPGMSSWAIVSHPGSLWVIFDPSGVSNWGVSLLCIAVQCSAILWFFAFWRFFGVFWAFFDFFCMIWSYIIIFRPPEHRKHHLNPKWGDLISSHFMYAFRDISTYILISTQQK